MLAVGRLVRIVKTIGDKVISKSRFYNTFNYLGYEREVGDWPLVGVWRVGLCQSRFLEKRRDNRFFESLVWFQWTTNRRRHMGYQMVT